MINRKLFSILTVFVFLIFLSTNISAICEEGQIDINSASEEKLQDIANIGPARAAEMITIRPFSSVDDMVRITGIAEKTLAQIKSQGIACVEDEEEKNESNEEADNANNMSENTTTLDDAPVKNEILLKPEVIKLNYPVNDTKDIKSEENSQILSKDKIAMYGFFVFSAIIGVLLIIRRKKIYQNDFR